MLDETKNIYVEGDIIVRLTPDEMIIMRLLIEKLKGYAYKPDFNKIFFEYLGLKLKKIFIIRKDKVFIKNFIEVS